MRRALMVSALAASVYACASGGQTPGALASAVSPVEATPGAPCAPAPLPKSIVDPVSVIDTAALAARLGDRPLQAPVLVAVHFGGDGALESVRFLGTAPDTQRAVSLANDIRSALRPLPKGMLWGLRIRVSGGRPVQLEFLRSEYCPPQPMPGASGELVQSMPVSEARDLRNAGPSRVHVLVDASGNPTQIRVFQSSGNRTMDNMNTEMARSLRYRPARLDGMPVPGWYVFNVRSR